ncbi:hypothetical protein [Lysobacter soli]|uniref:hypothetical protein n=1 Tax=Lysobacter soli TaxID=453783 RepID=UPI00240FD521|nr:hypothetical protein [Lysobacter soli]MDG2517839.1 hypothetical protein [Lysobacter soli]
MQLIIAFSDVALNALYTRARGENRNKLVGAPNWCRPPAGALRLAEDDRRMLDAVIRGEMNPSLAALRVSADNLPLRPA